MGSSLIEILVYSRLNQYLKTRGIILKRQSHQAVC